MTASRLQALRAGDDVLLDGELHTVQAVSATSVRLANVVGVVSDMPLAELLASPGFTLASVPRAPAPLPPSVDELGYMELDRRGAELLFQVLTEREEKASLAIASNESFSKAHMFAATFARRYLEQHAFSVTESMRPRGGRLFTRLADM